MSTSVLVVGGGSIGERHARCFLATERTHVSVADTDAARLEPLAARYPLAGTYDSFEAGLATRPQLVVIATPAPLHVPMALTAAEAGCHVLIEKPLSTTTAGIDSLRQTARRQRAVIGVAYVLRHCPGLAAVREAVRAGDCGPPLELVYVGGQDFAALRPAYREIYYRQRATGGGATQDALTHSFNAAEWIVGPATRLVADAAHLALDGVEVEDTVHVMARHGDVLASYSLNQHQPPNEAFLQVNGRDGSLRWEPHTNRWRRMRRGSDTWEDFPYDWPDRDCGFIAQAHAMLDAVAGNGPPPCSLEEALQTLHGCLAMLQSVESGHWIDVPAVDGPDSRNSDP